MLLSLRHRRRPRYVCRGKERSVVLRSVRACGKRRRRKTPCQHIREVVLPSYFPHRAPRTAHPCLGYHSLTLTAGLINSKMSSEWFGILAGVWTRRSQLEGYAMLASLFLPNQPAARMWLLPGGLALDQDWSFWDLLLRELLQANHLRVRADRHTGIRRGLSGRG